MLNSGEKELVSFPAQNVSRKSVPKGKYWTKLYIRTILTANVLYSKLFEY